MPASLERILNPTSVDPLHWRSPAPVVLAEEPEIALSSTTPIKARRTLKACSQCRRDKCRCNNARPCAGCIKKGRSHLCFTGCVSCRSRRLGCDTSRPCAACRESGRECLEEHPTGIASRGKKRRSTGPTSTSKPAPTRILPTSSHLRLHQPTPESRIKLACTTCRRDSKKCAGGQPCPRCSENGEECIYIARAPKLVKQRCQLCRTKNKKCEDARPCVHCIRAGIECVDLARKGIGPGLRVKKACARCRLDKVQCEKVRPCSGCQRKKIACVERECPDCVKKGAKCALCTRRDYFHRDDAEWEDCESGSDGEGPSIPPTLSSHPTASASPYTLPLPLDPRPCDAPTPTPALALPPGAQRVLSYPTAHFDYMFPRFSPSNSVSEDDDGPRTPSTTSPLSPALRYGPLLDPRLYDKPDESTRFPTLPKHVYTSTHTSVYEPHRRTNVPSGPSMHPDHNTFAFDYAFELPAAFPPTASQASLSLTASRGGVPVRVPRRIYD